MSECGKKEGRELRGDDANTHMRDLSAPKFSQSEKSCCHILPQEEKEGEIIQDHVQGTFTRNSCHIAVLYPRR